MSKGRKFLVVCAGFGLLAASLLANGTAPAGARATVAATVPAGPFNPIMTNRENVRQLFYSVHEAPTPPIGWTGSVSPCNPGTVSAAYLEATRTRINYFRAMAGIQTDVSFDATRNANAQAAALLESANVRFPDPPGPGLNHNPPNTWTCYSAAGATGASTSNLAAGNTGPDAIDQLMFDDGALGHRRWTLDPQITQMGSGSVPNNAGGIPIEAQVVLPETLSTRPAVRDNFIAWPPKGFVPYQVVYPRWSFALPNANFSAATVTMTRNGVSIPTAIQTRDSDFAGPTITWRPDPANISDTANWPQPSADDVYSVTVANVLGVSPSSYTYNVTVFDPAVADPSHTQPVITGPASAPSGQNTAYSFNAVPNATGYKWRSTKLGSPAADGAENGLVNFDAQVTNNYPPVQSDRKATGNNAFHLDLCPTAGCPTVSNQILTRKKSVLVSANSQLHFKSDLENFDSTALRARVEVSQDDGATWSSVHEETSSGVDNQPFTDQTVSLGTVSNGTFVGKTVKLRFLLTAIGSFYVGDRFGWFFDDVAFTNTQEADPPVEAQVAPNTTSFNFNPSSHSATYNLQVQPIFPGSGAGDWGPVKQVTSPK